MKKFHITYNRNTCIGCGACQIACKEHNSLMEGEFMRRVTLCEKATDSGRSLYAYTFSCNHCTNPKCTAVCPTGAMHKAPDGTVVHDDTLCVACGRCYWACPYGEVSFSKRTGLTQKCDGCLGLRKDGKAPKCVSFCPTGSLQFVEEEVQGEVIETQNIACGTERIYLVLGGGAAALYSAKAIREEDGTGRIIMLSDEGRRPYRRPMLSKSPFRNFREEELSLFREDWLRENQVELHLKETVLSLDTEKKTVTTDKGLYTYDKCIYALGSSAFIPPFPGRDKKGVYAVRTIQDIERIRRSTLKGNNAVIIGGGVIGIELAQELKKYGMSVTILEAMPRLMARLLDRDTSARLLEKLKEVGIETEVGVRIEKITGEDEVTGVRLEDDRWYKADLVIVSCGIKANTQVARDAGIACGRAVIVNSRMETSAKDVWACGDAAELDGVNYALWSQAMEEGITAGRNAAGSPCTVRAFDTSLILNSENLNLFVSGDTGLDDTKDYLEETSFRTESGFLINEREHSAYTKMVYHDGELTGVAILGNLKEMNRLKEAMEEEHESD